MSQQYNGQSNWGDGSTYSPTALQVAQRAQNHPAGDAWGQVSILGQTFTIPGLDAASQAVADVMFGGGEIAVAAASLVGTDGAATPMALELAADGVLRLTRGVGSVITLENPVNGSTLTATYPTTVPPVPVVPAPPVVSTPPAPIGNPWPPSPWGAGRSGSAPTTAEITDAVMHTAEGAHGTSLATAMDTVAGNLDAPVSGVQTAVNAIETQLTDIGTDGVWLKVAEETRLLARMFGEVQSSAFATLAVAIDLIVKDDSLLPFRGVGVNPQFTLLSQWIGEGLPAGYSFLKYDTAALDPTLTLAANLDAMNAGTAWVKNAQGIYAWEDADFNVWGCLVTDAQFVRDTLGVKLTPVYQTALLNAFFNDGVGSDGQSVTDLLNNQWQQARVQWFSAFGGMNPGFTLKSVPPGAGAAPSQRLKYDVATLDGTLDLHGNLAAQNPGLTFTADASGWFETVGADGYTYVCLVSQADFDRDVNYLYTPTSGLPKRSALHDLQIMFALIPVNY